MKKKILAWLLILSLCLGSFSGFESMSFAGAELTYSGGEFFTSEPYRDMTWNEFKILNGIPAEVAFQNMKGHFFNIEIWNDLQRIVYGDYTMVSDNDFKNGTLRGVDTRQGTIDNTVGLVNQGYYVRGSMRGEYRYHGYDFVGNKHTNGDFPMDSDRGKHPEEKNWIYRPWQEGEKHHDVSRVTEPSLYNQIATQQGELGWRTTREYRDSTRRWINASFPYKIVHSNHSSKNVYNYAHIYTPPTTLFPGDAMMQHLNAESVWYQHFTLAPLKDKNLLPLEGELEVLNYSESMDGDEPKLHFEIQVDGHLLDDFLFDGVGLGPDGRGVGDFPEESARPVFYNRDDIKSWQMTVRNTRNGEIQTLEGTRVDFNRGRALFNFEMAYEEYEPYVNKDTDELFVGFQGNVKLTFHDGKTLEHNPFDVVKVVRGEIPKKSSIPVNPQIPIPEPPSTSGYETSRKPVRLNVDAPNNILDTQRFGVTDSIEGVTEVKRQIYLNGRLLSESESQQFLNGTYLFPLEGHTRIYTYRIVYDLVPTPAQVSSSENMSEEEIKEINEQLSNENGSVSFEYLNYVVVHGTNPRSRILVDGTFKQNRKVTAEVEINSYLADFPRSQGVRFISEDLSVNHAENGFIGYGEKSNDKLSLISREVGKVTLENKVRAHVPPHLIQRNDIPHGYHENRIQYVFFVLEDFPPYIAAHIWNGHLARGEEVQLTVDVSSYDHDLIDKVFYQIVYSRDNTDKNRQIVEQGKWEDFKGFTPDKLGYYEFQWIAKEDFGQETLKEHIRTSDYLVTEVKRTIFVDNYAPMTAVYSDIEYELPKADVVILTDEAIERDVDMVGLEKLNEKIGASVMDWSNLIRNDGVHTFMHMWDLYTYIHSNYVTTEDKTNTKVPSTSYQYESDGWKGRLDRTHYVNNRYRHDFGRDVPTTKTSSKTATDSRSESGSLRYGESQPNGLPSSVSYSDAEGYSGTLYQDNYSYSDSEWPDKRGFDWSRHATYSGTVTRTYTENVWQPNWQWVDNYTGYYAGTVYKPIKQSFTPSFRSESDKFIVYFADDKVNHRADIQHVLKYSESEVILVAKPSARSGVSHHHFIDSRKELDEIMKEVSEYIAEKSVMERRLLVLPGERFQLFYADLDDEEDPIISGGFQYVHDKDHFDNPTGQEPGTVTELREDGYTQSERTHFNNVGLYTIARRIEDEPKGYEEFSRKSNTARLQVLVHRRPIAKFELDWDYNPHRKVYETTWVDLSYDLDHQFSDAERGIRERRIRYRQTDGDNQWIYRIPDDLKPGTYEVRYMVRDIERAWSDEAVKVFTLSDTPDIQLEGKLRTLDERFSLQSIPASEYLELYDVWTRYPYDHHLKPTHVSFHNHYENPLGFFYNKSLPENNKNKRDFFWQDLIFQIPAHLKDGEHHVRLEAICTESGRFRKLILPFTVQTPIAVKGEVEEMLSGDQTTLYARTPIYASSVEVTLFQGTSFQRKEKMQKVKTLPQGEILWKWTGDVPHHITEGVYSFRFEASTPAGERAVDIRHAKVHVLQILDLEIIGAWNPFEIPPGGPHFRLLSHEYTEIQTLVKGNPDKVWLRFSPELEAMAYTDKKGHRHHYSKYFKKEVDFPLVMDFIGEERFKVSYIIPLADQTLTWENKRKKSPYTLTLYAQKGDVKVSLVYEVDLTGNIYDLMHLSPHIR